MKARFTNFSENKDLKDCIFALPKLLNGSYKLDTIYNSKNISKDTLNKGGWFYTYNQVLNLDSFMIFNVTGQSSKYSTSKGFINRIKKELTK